MPIQYPFTTIVVVLALSVYVWLAMWVGKARGKYGVVAPIVDGPPEFLRIYRAHINTLEQIVLFLPAVAMFAIAWGDQAAAAVGIFWPVGRVLYGLGYAKAAEKRGPGFGLSFLSSAILLIGALVAGIMTLV
ncbi:MAG: MAPEG family protein [Rhodospirillaceae bacterium]